MKNNIVTIAIGIISVLLVAAVVVVIAGEDKTGPVISFNIPDGQQITYTSGEDEKKLIAYAKAVDEKDGDVSASIMIEDIYVMYDLQTAKVIYVARDNDNNISKTDKIVKYTASKDELDALNKQNSEVSSAGTASTKANAETKVQESTTKVQDTASTIPASARPVLVLSRNEVTISQGDGFSPVSYVKEITDDKDTRSVLFTRIIVNGNYDAKTPGDYTISVFCTDTEGNASNSEKLILHVEAKEEETEKPKETTTEKAETKQQTVSR